MNPSTALATALVDGLVAAGVREAVLSPGSRNAPLSFALHAADRAGRLRLHVRIDERTAGFLALGLAKAADRPVPVVTTSGTAAVNLHPAVVEADLSGVPLVVLTADRPVELRGVGANQTIDQLGLYGGAVRLFEELDPDQAPGAWRAALARALAAAGSGPVHLDVALRDPLVPDGTPTAGTPAAPPAADRPGRSATPPPAGAVLDLDPQPRTVLVAGDGAGPVARALAEQAGWPLLAEPSSGARSGPHALAAYRLLLDLDPALSADVQRVVVLGRPTLSRPVTRLLARTDVDLVVVPGRGPATDPARRARVAAGVRVPDGPTGDGWLDRWQAADRAARGALATLLDHGPLTGPGLARAVAAALPAGGLLVSGSSSAVRDLDLADPWDTGRRVLANRGAAGIDGTVSTAIGAALAHRGPALALLGDLTFLHDSTGLVIGPDEPRPDLTLVVHNDDGGGLFGLLEQGAPAHAGAFERVFGTAHGVDLGALCAATATPHLLVDDREDLAVALEAQPGLRVVEVRTDRRAGAALHVAIRAAVAAALPVRPALSPADGA